MILRKSILGGLAVWLPACTKCACPVRRDPMKQRLNAEKTPEMNPRQQRVLAVGLVATSPRIAGFERVRASLHTGN